MSLLIALYLQAATTVTPPPAAPREDSALSGVVVTSPNTGKRPPPVYTPNYKAAPHLAPGAPTVSGSMTIDQMFSGGRFRTGSLMSLSMNAIVGQRYRAKKAAELINAGRCPDALQGAFNEGDGYLTYRIAQVCNLPVPIERPH